jgi:hypothetical protein
MSGSRTEIAGSRPATSRGWAAGAVMTVLAAVPRDAAGTYPLIKSARVVIGGAVPECCSYPWRWGQPPSAFTVSAEPTGSALPVFQTSTPMRG